MLRDDATLLDIANAAHLIHNYDAVDLDEVWKTATHDVPEVLSKIQPLLPKQPGESS